MDDRSKLVFGNFNSEEYWRDINYAELPSYKDLQIENIVSAMDEILFPFCNVSNDTLITRYPMEQMHYDYLNEIGFCFQNKSIFKENAQSNYCNSIESQVIKDAQNRLNNIVPKIFRIEPFSIIPDTKEFCRIFNSQNLFPNIDDVVKVNSKIFSHKISHELLGENHATIVYSSEEFATIGTKMLADSKAVLAKDPYGVSGKGNFLIESKAMLKSLSMFILKQEKKGKEVCFLLEKLLDKYIDFSFQFEISENNDFRTIAIHEMENNNFCFSGIRAASDNLKNILEKTRYYDTVVKISDCLFNSGYFGPVCLDSMITSDGLVIPIIEINARSSMGFINRAIDQRLSASNLSSKLSYFSLGITKNFSISEFLSCLEKSELLFQKSRPYGIIPLTTTTITINAKLNEYPYKGRFYFSIVPSKQFDETIILKMLKEQFNKLGAKVY